MKDINNNPTAGFPLIYKKSMDEIKQKKLDKARSFVSHKSSVPISKILQIKKQSLIKK